MSLYDQYLERRDNPPNDPAKVALFGILADLTDRGGIGGEFDAIDDDIKEEMLGDWLNSIKTCLPAETVQNLQSCKSLLDEVSAEEVDDAEELLTSFACEGADYSTAIGEVLKGFGLNEEEE